MTIVFCIFRKTLLVQFSGNISNKPIGKYHVPVCLKKVSFLIVVPWQTTFITLVSCYSTRYHHIFIPKMCLMCNLSVFILYQGCSDVSGFMHAVLSLLLPLGYEYDPNLVMLVRMPGCGMQDSVWQQLTGLLRGLAQGHTLILMQVRRVGEIIPENPNHPVNPPQITIKDTILFKKADWNF